MEYQQETGELVGLTIDLANFLSQEINVHMETVWNQDNPNDYNLLVDSLNARETDLTTGNRCRNSVLRVTVPLIFQQLLFRLYLLH